MIREIQNELDSSKDLSMEEISPVRPPKRSVRARKVKTETVYFKEAKEGKTPTASSEVSFTSPATPKRGFKCYSEDDVLKFNDFKQVKLTYNLIKGDDDEDTDEEDKENGQKFAIFNLEKALTSVLKNTR